MRDALRHSTRVAGGSSSFSLPHFIGEPPHNADGDADGNRIPPQHAASRQTPLNSGFLHRIPPHHAQRIGLRTEKVAGSSPAERASEILQFAGRTWAKEKARQKRRADLLQPYCNPLL